jgi:hypothetical protein
MHWIRIYFNSSGHKYQMERLPDAKMRERYRVIAGNGEILLSNNRPILLRKRLKH